MEECNAETDAVTMYFTSLIVMVWTQHESNKLNMVREPLQTVS